VIDLSSPWYPREVVCFLADAAMAKYRSSVQRISWRFTTRHVAARYAQLYGDVSGVVPRRTV